jgi:hypothetical protein
VNPDEVHRAGERGDAIGHPQLNGAASPLGLLQHGRMVHLIVAQQPVGEELRDAPIPFDALDFNDGAPEAARAASAGSHPTRWPSVPPPDGKAVPANANANITVTSVRLPSVRRIPKA